MIKRAPLVVTASLAFLVAVAIAETPPAYAAGTCSVAALVCANDSNPGCETICGGNLQAMCTEGTCTPGGNVATPNRCTCK
jgi:hypothetical protein